MSRKTLQGSSRHHFSRKLIFQIFQNRTFSQSLIRSHRLFSRQAQLSKDESSSLLSDMVHFGDNDHFSIRILRLQRCRLRKTQNKIAANGELATADKKLCGCKPSNIAH